MDIVTFIAIVVATILCADGCVWLVLGFYSWYSLKRQQKRREELRREKERLLKEYKEGKGFK